MWLVPDTLFVDVAVSVPGVPSVTEPVPVIVVKSKPLPADTWVTVPSVLDVPAPIAVRIVAADGPLRTASVPVVVSIAGTAVSMLLTVVASAETSTPSTKPVPVIIMLPLTVREPVNVSSVSNK